MKKIFITGAGGGIGQKLVEKYRKEGYRVVGQYCHRPIQGEGEWLQADLTDTEQVLRLCKTLEEKHSDLDCAVLNAGADWYGLLTEMPVPEIESLVQLNLTSNIILAGGLGKIFLKNHAGNLLFMSSVWGEYGGSCEAAYSATKGGLIALAKALSKEWGLSGVRVNALCPGCIDTPMNGIFSAEELSSFAEGIALGRVGRAEEVAETAFFLTSEKASYITGQCIGVNGGY